MNDFLIYIFVAIVCIYLGNVIGISILSEMVDIEIPKHLFFVIPLFRVYYGIKLFFKIASKEGRKEIKKYLMLDCKYIHYLIVFNRRHNNVNL